MPTGNIAGAARYSIECFERGAAQQQAVADLVTMLGGIVEVTTPDQYRMEATLTPIIRMLQSQPGDGPIGGLEAAVRLMAERAEARRAEGVAP